MDCTTISSYPTPPTWPAALRPTALGVLQLPELTPNAARLARLLADDRLSGLLQLAFNITGLSIGPASAFAPTAPGRLELRRGADSASVTIDLGGHPALASAALEPDTASCPGSDVALRSAVAAILLEPLCEALASLGFEPVKVHALHRLAPLSGDDSECSWISFRISGRLVEFRLDQIDDGLLSDFERLVAMQRMPFARRVSQLNVPGRLQIGERTMSVGTLRSLRPGDVILRAVQPGIAALFADPPAPATVPAIWGRAGMCHLSCIARLDADKLILSGAPLMAYETHYNDSPVTGGSDTQVEISDLELPVTVEIDTLSLPVAQLSALRPGYVLELPVPVRHARVRLVSYGQTVGFGELVAVGEHIGVRVLQMSHQSDPV